MAFNVQILGLVTAALLFSGCGNLPPYRELFDTSPEAVGTGITGVGLAKAMVIIAKYQATERQRQVAEQNARRAYQKIVAQYQERRPPSHPTPVIRRPVNKPRVRPTPPATSPEAKLPPPVNPSPIPQYLAVDTVQDTRSKGEKSVMIWDTASQELVGNDVYDIRNAPRLNQEAQFGSQEAQYVGSGNF